MSDKLDSTEDQINIHKETFLKKTVNIKKLLMFGGTVFTLGAVCAPFERLQVLAQCRSDLINYGYNTKFTNALSTSREIANSGWSTFFKGARISFARNMFYFTLNIKLYFKIRNRVEKNILFRNNKMGTDLMSGTMTNLMTSVFLYPFDLIKTKMQVEVAPRNEVMYKRIYWSYRRISST